MIWVWYYFNDDVFQWDFLVYVECDSDEWSDFQCYEWFINIYFQEMVENLVDVVYFKYVYGIVDYFFNWNVSYDGLICWVYIDVNMDML